MGTDTPATTPPRRARWLGVLSRPTTPVRWCEAVTCASALLVVSFARGASLAHFRPYRARTNRMTLDVTAYRPSIVHDDARAPPLRARDCIVTCAARHNVDGCLAARIPGASLVASSDVAPNLCAPRDAPTSRVVVERGPLLAGGPPLYVHSVRRRADGVCCLLHSTVDRATRPMPATRPRTCRGFC